MSEGGGGVQAEDRMSVLLNTYFTRLRVHVVIYINKLFSAEGHRTSASHSTRIVFADLVFVDCCDQSWACRLRIMACKTG